MHDEAVTTHVTTCLIITKSAKSISALLYEFSLSKLNVISVYKPEDQIGVFVTDKCR